MIIEKICLIYVCNKRHVHIRFLLIFNEALNGLLHYIFFLLNLTNAFFIDITIIGCTKTNDLKKNTFQFIFWNRMNKMMYVTRICSYFAIVVGTFIRIRWRCVCAIAKVS